MEIKQLEGKMLTAVDVNKDIDDSQDHIIFTSEDSQYKMTHIQDCCESVYIVDINGDLEDLIGSPILTAEERTQEGDSEWGTSTWTFYTIRTVKGSVDIRWHGESNGYYSESVDFFELT